MRRKVFIKVLLVTLLLCSTATLASPIVLEYKIFSGTPYYVITTDLNSSDIKVDVQVATNKSQAFQTMIKGKPYIACINAAFFDLKTNVIISDIVKNTMHVNKGWIGNNFCVDGNREVSFIDRDINVFSNWQGYQTIVSGGPTLIKDGNIVLDARKEGFKTLPLIPRERVAIGHTKSNKLLFVATNRPTTLNQLADVMIRLGSVNSISMDGGGSTAMSYKGRITLQPLRKLTNIITIEEVPYANQGLSKDSSKRASSTSTWIRPSICWDLLQGSYTSSSSLRLQPMHQDHQTAWGFNRGGSERLL